MKFKDMFITFGESMFIVAGILFIIVSIKEGSYLVKCKNDKLLNQSLKENYQIIDEVRFRKIMLQKSVLNSSIYLIMGILCILYRTPLICILTPLPGIIDGILIKKSRKYISTN